MHFPHILFSRSIVRERSSLVRIKALKTNRARPTVALLGEMFPADPVGIGMMLEPLGLAAGPVVPTREWRELYSALDCAVVGAIHPFYTASVREFEAAGRPVVGSAPVGRALAVQAAERIADTPTPGRARCATSATRCAAGRW